MATKRNKLAIDFIKQSLFDSRKQRTTLKDFKNAKNENYYFLNPEYFKSSLTSTLGWKRQTASILTLYRRFYRQWPPTATYP